MWPSEEILAFYLKENQELLSEITAAKKVLELGAGQSGLVGFMLGVLGPSTLEVTITDGNA